MNGLRVLGRFGLDANELGHRRTVGDLPVGDSNIEIARVKRPTLDLGLSDEFIEALGRWLADVASNAEQGP